MKGQDIRSLLQAQGKGETVDETKFYFWLNITLKYIHKRLVEYDPERFIQSKEYTINSTNLSQDLPKKDIDGFDFGDMRADGCGLYIEDVNGIIGDPLPVTQFGSEKIGYFLSVDKINFTPRDFPSDTYLMRFISAWKDKTSSDTDIGFPDDAEMKHIIVEGIKMLKAIDKQNFDVSGKSSNDEILSDARFEEKLDEMLSFYNREDELLYY